MSKKFDYVIIGAGCAGLSLATRMALDPYFNGSEILLIEPEEKLKNDRTFSHWSKDHNDIFSEVYTTKFDQLFFASPDWQKQLDIDPYQFKLLLGKDFYSHCKSILESSSITWKKDQVDDVISHGDVIDVQCSSGDICHASYVFDSRMDSFTKNENEHFVWQHFRGWFIKTNDHSFKTTEATFMDFRIDQGGESRFFYVLPMNEKEALVEVAVFSNEIPRAEVYDEWIRAYIQEKLAIKEYQVTEIEMDKIPMTTQHFNPKLNKNHIKIGTAAGMVKASSGFAFYRIQQHTQRIVKELKQDQIDLRKSFKSKSRFRLYDKTLLHVILNDKVSASVIFTALFKHVKPNLILKFLNEETHFIEEIKVMSSVPIFPFVKALLKELLKPYIRVGKG